MIFLLILSIFSSSKVDTLNILYTGCSNGNLRACHCPGAPYGGLPRRKTLIDSLKKRYKDLLIFDTGDLFGSPAGSDRYRDSIFFEAFNRIEYTAVGIGDQEFSEGVPFFLKRLKLSKNHFISTNLYYKDSLLTPPYLIKKVGDLRIGIISLLNPTLFSFYPKKKKQGLQVADPFLSFESILPEIESKADIIILLSHLGYRKERQIAKKFKEIDVILSGHSCAKTDSPIVINRTILVGAGVDGKFVGFLQLLIKDKRIKDSFYKIIPLSSKIADDPLLMKITQPYFDRIERWRLHPPPIKELEKSEGKRVKLFYAPDCEHCERIIEEFLPKVKAKHPELYIEYLSIDEPENYRLLENIEKRLGGKHYDIPVIVFGNRILGGEEEIREKLEGLLESSPAQTSLKEETEEPSSEEGISSTQLVYFYQSGCERCDRVRYLLSALKKEFPHLKIFRYDLGLPENKRLAEAFGIFYNIPEKQRLLTPLIFVGGDWIGKDGIDYDTLTSLIKKNLGREIPFDKIKSLSAQAEESIFERFKSFGFLPILSAGLLDGINPCAFTTLILFIAYLSIMGVAGRRITWIAISFILAVFLSYLSIGLGAYKVLSYLTSLQIVFKIIIGVTIAILFVFAGLSLYDFIVSKRGDAEKMKLKLPEVIRKRISKTIIQGAPLGGYILGAFLVGILVSLFEFICTGQVYLPTLVFVARVPNLRADAFFYLILYNLAFIFPLVGVFLLARFGFINERTQERFSKHIPTIKFLTFLLFLFLGGFLLHTLL